MPRAARRVAEMRVACAARDPEKIRYVLQACISSSTFKWFPLPRLNFIDSRFAGTTTTTSSSLSGLSNANIIPPLPTRFPPHDENCTAPNLLQQVVNAAASDFPRLAPLHVAALSKDAPLVRDLLLAGANPTIRTDFGATPLHLAARASALDVVNILLQASTSSVLVPTSPIDHFDSDDSHLDSGSSLDVDATADSGATPLIYAAQVGCSHVAEALLRMPHQADVDARADGLVTALHIAAANGYASFASLLLRHGAAVNAPDSQGRVPLLDAIEKCTHNQLAVVQVLLHAGALSSIRDKPRGFCPLAYAAYAGNTSVVHAILAFAGFLNDHNLEAASSNSSSEDYSTVTGRTEQRPRSLDQNIYRRQQRSKFDRNGMERICINERGKMIVDDDGGSDESDDSGNELEYSPNPCRRCFPSSSVTPFSLGLNAKDICGHTPLALAAIAGNVSVVQLLVDALRGPSCLENVDPFARDCEGRTPLWHAARKDFYDICLALLRFSEFHDSAYSDRTQGSNRVAWTNIHAPDKHKLTPLHVAALSGNLPICRLLLHHGALVNALDERGRTALGIAALSGHAEVCALLLESQADPICPGVDGRTPLWLAAHGGHNKLVKELLKHNVIRKAVDHRSRTGATALFAASQAGHRLIVASLLRAGAYVDAVNGDGSSPLWAAAEHGHSEVIRLLLEHHACVDLVGRDGKSPVAIACGNGHVEAASLFLAHDCIVDCEQTAGGSTLLEATKLAGRNSLTSFLQNYMSTPGSDLTNFSSSERLPDHESRIPEEATSRNSYAWLRKLPSAHRKSWKLGPANATDVLRRSRFSLQL